LILEVYFRKEVGIPRFYTNPGEKLKPKIAVVGGAGFIGRSLSRHFVEKFQVKIVGIKPPSGDLKGPVSQVLCDVRNY
jgi:nucleoside-diphosphate-sugar epimerase